MIVGTLTVRLLVRSARTLKDKRQVVQSVKERLRQSFNVSVAEVEAQDQRQQIVLAWCEPKSSLRNGGLNRPRVARHAAATPVRFVAAPWFGDGSC